MERIPAPTFRPSEGRAAAPRRRGRPGRSVLTISLLALTAALFLPVASQGEVVDRIVLRVNDRVATLLEYEERRAEGLSQIAAQQDLSPEELDRQTADLGSRVFRKMFEDLLLLSRADQLGVFPSESSVDAAVQRLRQSFGIQSDDEFAAALSQQGMSLAEFREEVRTQLRIRDVVAQEVTSQIELEEDDLRRVYRSERDSFVTPRRWQVRELVVLEADDRDPEEVRRLAESIHAEILAGQAIEDLATRYSEAGTTSSLVELGWVQEGELSPALDGALQDLQEGDVSAPVAARGGLHIMQIQAFEDSKLQPFSEVAGSIESRERRRLFAEEFQDYMASLEQDAYVVADPPPGAAGFRTAAGARSDVDPFADFEEVPGDEGGTDQGGAEPEIDLDEPPGGGA